MPIYEYACGECGNTFERLLSFNAASVNGVSCPDCGGDHPRRLVSVFSAVTKSATGVTTKVVGTGSSCSTGGCGCSCAH